MNTKKYITLLVMALLSLTSWAANTLSVTKDLTGAAGKTITVPIEMTNTDEIVAMQFNIKLPFAKSSDNVTLNAARNVNGHTVNIRSLGNNTYTVVVVNMQNKPLGGNSGILVNMPMTIGSDAQPGEEYDITLSDVILTNKRGDNIQTGNSTGKLTIQKVPTPDLTPTNITMKESAAMPGDAITVNWYVENVGDSIATAGWTENIYLVNSATEEKIYLGNSRSSAVLVKGQRVSRSATLNIPRSLGVDGDVFVAVTVVGNSGLGEIVADKANNTNQSAGTLSLGKMLYLTPTDGKIAEDSSSPLRMQLSRSGDWSTAETFALSVRDSHGLITVPATVTIPQGQSGVTFYVNSVNNAIVNTADVETVVVEAGNGYSSVEADVKIEDDEFLTMKLTLDKSEITEGEDVVLTIDLQKVFDEDLVVSISSDLPRRFSMPNTVVFPAGTQKKQVNIKTVEDDIADMQKSVAFYGVANHYNKSEVVMLLNDNDMPDIALEITPTTISEGAGLTAIMATLKRTTATNSAITVRLSDNDNGHLYYPSTLQMAAGVENVQFNIGAVNNGKVDGDRNITLTASVYVQSCSCDASGDMKGVTETVITVLDDDGPSLSMTMSSSMVQEGSSAGTTVTVKRNTSTTSALTVNLSAEDADLEIPSSVTIPAGSESTTFVARARANDVTGDTRTVVITANAPGFTRGTTWLMISDETLPDAMIASIELPASVNAKSSMNATFNIQNNGAIELPKGVEMYVYVGGQCVDTLITNNAIAAGAEMAYKATVKVPDMIGVKEFYATINPENKVTEVLFVNNTSPKYNITLTTPYTAVASVAKDRYELEEAVVVSGHAVGPDVANVPVEVYVINEGMRFTVNTTTAEDGSFVATYIPESYLMGHFSVGACYPGAGESAEQSAFNIYGLRRVNNGYIKCQTLVDIPYEGAITVQNPGILDLHNVNVEILSQEDNYEVEFTSLSSLKGGESKNVAYRITSTSPSASYDWDNLRVRFTTDEGASFTTTLYCYARVSTGQLKANISRINTTMIKDESRDYSFTITNVGDGNTGTISVDLPSNARWMKSVTPIKMSSLPKDSTATVILRFTPTEDMPLNVNVTGNIAINVENGTGLSLPFTIFPVSSKTGTLVVDVCDENTYYTQEAPHLKGAGVTVYNYSNNSVVTQGLTGEDGTFSCELPEGYYKISVTEKDHDSYTGNVQVDPGKSVTEVVNLSINAISIDWTVVETEVEDVYDIKTTVTYETSVPVPVVETIFPKKIPLDLIERDGYCILNAILTNKGLITAQDCSFYLDEDAGLDVEYLAENVQDIAPGVSVVIPVRLSFTDASAGAKGYHGVKKKGSTLKCVLDAFIEWLWACGPTQKEANDKLVSDLGSCGGGGPTGTPTDPKPGHGSPGKPSIPPSVPGGYTPSTSDPRPDKPVHTCNECVNKIFETITKEIVHNIPIISVVEEVEEVLECVQSRDGVCIATQLIQKNKYVEKVVGYKKKVETITEVIEYCMKNHNNHNMKIKKKAGTVLTDVSELVSSGGIPSYLGTYLERTLNSMEHANQLVEAYEKLYGDPAFMTMSEAEGAQFESGYTLYKAGTITLDEFATTYLPDYITKEQLTNYVERMRNIEEGNTGNGNYPDFDSLDENITNVQTLNEEYMKEGFSGVTDYMKNAIKEEQDAESGQTGVCASVKIEINQTMTMTRQAFLGTLTVTNGNEVNAMTDVKLNLEVIDEFGNVATSHEFQINPTSLTGFTGELNFEDGWSLAPRETGVATVTFIPTKYAAPDAPVQYSFGGTLSYVNPFGGQVVTRSLYPAVLTVKPSPELDLTYFMQRDLLGDNALTPDVVEPTVPGEFALLINNKGKGDATKVNIATQQPMISQDLDENGNNMANEKGLLIDFEIVSSRVNGKDKTLALGGTVPADFGTIAAGTQSYAQWELQSSLLGHFVAYDVSYTHVTSYDNPDLTLLDKVTIHEMEHSIDVPTGGGENLVAWLVNDINDSRDLPDAIYFSDARVEELHVLSDECVTATKISSTQVNIQVLPERGGWNYANIADPALGKASVKRIVRQSDGVEIPLKNFWQTEWTLKDGTDPLHEYRLHFADNIPLEGETYELEFDPIPTVLLEVNSLLGPHTGEPIEITPLQKIDVNFNKVIDPATFTTDALKMRCQGQNVDMSAVTIDTDDNRNFSLGIGGVTTEDGYYVLSVATNNITDEEGYQGKNGKSVDWIQFKEGLIRLTTSVYPQNSGDVTMEYVEPQGENNAKGMGMRKATVVSTSGSETLPYNTEVKLSAASKVGYKFEGWYIGDECVSTAEEFYSVYVDHTTITAKFTECNVKLTVEYNELGGRVTGGGSGTYGYGTNLKLRALPSDGYVFTGWVVGKDIVTESEINEFILQEDKTVKAEFVLKGGKIGDVNVDGLITISDVIALSNLVLDRSVEGTSFVYADANIDKTITVSDMTAVTNMFLGNASAKGNMYHAPVSSQMEPLSYADMQMYPGNATNEEVNFEGYCQYCCFQFDMNVPEGFHIEKITSGADSNHIIGWNKMSNGLVRVICYSFDNSRIANGAVADMSVVADFDVTDGQYPMTVSNIILGLPDASSVFMGDKVVMLKVGNDANGISNAAVDTDADSNLYDLQGRRITKATLSKGVYINNGRKIIKK